MRSDLSTFNRGMSSILSAGDIHKQSCIKISFIIHVLDLIDKGTEYEIHCDLPGVAKEDLEVQITEDMVYIRGVRRQVHEEDTEFTHRIERTFGKVERTLRLPKNADTGKAKAKFEGGVLLVSFPKIPGIESGIKRIEIA